ncbi:MAG: GlsB/YeaQ/YmgE family stress response membrane protein [Planctomycetaceae bacterium]
MGFASWIAFGLIAGALARFVMPGPDRGGCLPTILIGICGAVVGGWIGTQFGWGTVQEFDLRSIGIATFGGVVLLFLRRLMLGR